jgi:hypothetical protein
MENMHLRRLMLLSLAGLLAMASPGPAAVFCVADNGHAAVEGILSPCCDDEATSFAPAMILEPFDADHRDAGCGPCVDLQLTSPSRLETPTKAALPMSGTPIMLAAVPTPAISFTTATHWVGRISPSPTLELLASVVLLT